MLAILLAEFLPNHASFLSKPQIPLEPGICPFAACLERQRFGLRQITNLGERAGGLFKKTAT